jgi:hypothetical protein
VGQLDLVAQRLSALHIGGPLVSAAPDAYGELLPARPQQLLRPGAHGLVVLDGAARAYTPGLHVHGSVVARFDAGSFERADGTLDPAAVTLVVGSVTRGP